MQPPTPRESTEVVVLLAVALVALVASGIGPREVGTWALEVAPVVITVPILAAT